MTDEAREEGNVVSFEHFDISGENGALKFFLDDRHGAQKNAEYIIFELRNYRSLINLHSADIMMDDSQKDAINQTWYDAVASVRDLIFSIPDDAEESFIKSEIRRVASIFKKAYTDLFIGDGESDVNVEDHLILADMEVVVDEIKDIGDKTDTYEMGVRSVKLCLQRLMTFADVWDVTESPPNDKKRNLEDASAESSNKKKKLDHD
jgi:hypothetical protein